MTDISLDTTSSTPTISPEIAAVRRAMATLGEAVLDLARQQGGYAATVSFSVADTAKHEPFDIAVDIHMPHHRGGEASKEV